VPSERLAIHPGLTPQWGMRLTSPEFSDGGELPWTMSAANENRMPALELHEVPEGAESLALVLEDLDSPVGALTHWLAWNLPPDTTHLDALTFPAHGRIGLSAFGKIGYLGPTPPEGRHIYRFTLSALDRMLDLPQGATRKQFQAAAKNHVMAWATLEGSIERSGSQG